MKVRLLRFSKLQNILLMKANIIVITFILFLAVLTFHVSTIAISENIDNVNNQQLELHKSVLAKKQLETLARYNQIDIKKEALEASFADIEADEPVVQIAISEDLQVAEGMVIEQGTTIHWVNEGVFPQVLSLEDGFGQINEQFGTNLLRAGDKFYYKFDQPAEWNLISSSAKGNSRCTIKVL